MKAGINSKKNYSDFKKESFQLKHKKNGFSIHSTSLPSKVYGTKEFNHAYSGEALFKECTPSFSLRTLSIKCHSSLPLSSSIGTYFPKYLKDPQNLKAFCIRILELGFNSVIFGPFTPSLFLEKSSDAIFEDLNAIIETFTKFDIHFILNPIFYKDETAKPLYKTLLFKETADQIEQSLSFLNAQFPKLHYLFWASLYEEDDFQFHPVGRKYTKEEKTRQEIKWLEQSLHQNTSLIYHLPCTLKNSHTQQSQWVGNLIPELKKNTTLCFYAIHDSSYENFQTEHPICAFSSPKDPLMPIFNLGGIDQGEGLWPNFPYELNLQFQKGKQLGYPGMIALCPELPKIGSFLDGVLDATGKAIWLDLSLGESMRLWLRQAYSQKELCTIFELLKETRNLIIEFSKLKHLYQDHFNKENYLEESKFLGNSFLTQCLLLEFQVNKASFLKKVLKEQYLLFFQDIKNFIRLFFNHFNIPLLQNLLNSRFETGLWIGFDKEKNNHAFLDSPLIAEPGSLSHNVLSERSLFKDP